MPVAQLTILGSGSSGNCAYLEADNTRLLIDAGLSGRQIRQRLLSIGRTPENLAGILITHEHSDHIQGLVGLAAKLHLPVYCNRPTQEAIKAQLKLALDFRVFETGTAFAINGLEVETFSIPHDAYDPVGFLVRSSGGTFGFLTDLGHATKLAIERIRQANVLLLESNHDLKLLQEDLKRPWSVKQRILSRHGHLSNDAASQVVEQIISADLRHLFLGHLSGDCNRPELALRTMRQTLERVGGTHVRIEVTSQTVPCPTLVLGGENGAPSPAKS